MFVWLGRGPHQRWDVRLIRTRTTPKVGWSRVYSPKIVIKQRDTRFLKIKAHTVSCKIAHDDNGSHDSRMSMLIHDISVCSRFAHIHRVNYLEHEHSKWKRMKQQSAQPIIYCEKEEEWEKRYSQLILLIGYYRLYRYTYIGPALS